MIIQPVIDKKTGKVKTNAQIIRSMYKALSELEAPTTPVTDEEKFERLQNLNKICNGHQNEVMAWLKQINDCPDDYTAQRMLSNTLLYPDVRPVAIDKKQIKRRK